jgi:hypothetical protein
MARTLSVALVFAACAPAPATSSVTLHAPTASAIPQASGAVLQQALPPLGKIAWQWSGDEPGFGRSFYKSPRTVTEGDVTCTFTYVETPSLARTACADAHRELWHVDEPHAFVEDAALVIHHGTLYAARFSNISTGCTLHAFDVHAGTKRWTPSRLVGLGPIGHSKYLNAVQLRIIEERPVVFGWESSGRYIEAVDPTTGAQAYHSLLEPARQPG